MLADAGRVAAAEGTRMRMEAMKRVLLVEDNPGDARLLRDMLNEETSHNTELTHVECMSDAEAHLAERRVDIILLDLGLPDTQGMGTVQRAHAHAPRVPLVVLTGWDDETVALQALQEGAQDYLVKGHIETRSLLRALRYAIERKIMEELRNRTEDELDAARQRLHYLVTENPAVIHALRLDRGSLSLAWISENVQRLLGYSVDEALAPEWWTDRVHPDERGRAVAGLARVLADGHASEEYRFRHRDGTYLWLRDEKRVLRDAAGRPTEVVGTWSDVTVAKSAEERLLESERRFRAVLGNLHLVSLMLDSDARITYCNDYLLRLSGWEQKELLGRDWFELFVPPEDRDQRAVFNALLLDRPEAWHHESEIMTRAGGRKLIRWNHSLLRSGKGQVMGAASIGEDITEQKNLEEALRQSQKMEAVGRLAGGVAHDFNNLLGVITGYSGLLLKNLGPQHPGSKRVEQIQKAADGAAGLTRQLLAFSRKQVLQPRILDLNEVVTEVEKMLRRVIGEDIQLVATEGRQLGRVLADPGQIEQVLMNLVVNARDAMPKGGGLVIETANVTLDKAYALAHSGVEPGPFVMLAVTDTGEGMDARTQTHIFEPFFTTKEEGKGTGLGLATVFGIVQQSGGSICVESRPGDGTTFKVYFPRVEDGLSRPSPPLQGEAPARGTESILLVEDAAPLRELISEILESAGYGVVAASDPEDALFKIASLKTPVRLMLTDVIMPRMSGPDLAQSIRVAQPEVKVLFMSGYTNEAMGVHGVLAAGTQFIQKPFAAEALLQKVRETLDEP